MALSWRQATNEKAASTMARSSKRRLPPTSGHKGDYPPLRWVFQATGAFLLLIVFFVGSSRIIKATPAGGGAHHLFQNPADISDSLLRSLDAVFVLGGGAPSSLDLPPVYTQRRCDDAARVVERKPALPILCLSAGTAHVPQLLSPAGLPIWESTASAAYLQAKYPSIRNVYVETTSYDTIGNAFFARTSHADIAGWKQILIVTNEFHMERTMAIFDWIFGLSPYSRPYRLYYLQSPNNGLDDDALTARREKEATSLASVHGLAKKYTSLKQLWQFMNHDHALYTAGKLIERGRASSSTGDGPTDLVKKSYGGA